ncbi:MAG: HAMP domain-containing histidine kinase [Rhodobacteraceae bacterium]|nr:HAMP domain-containing histidine kinase [Paracoccaceae bacterium]
MTPLIRIVRTTAFKLSLIYILVFSGLSGFLLYYISQNTTGLMARQVVQTVDAEIGGLSEEYARGGVRALVESIERRARRPGASLYLLVDFAGNAIVGNIARLPTIVLDEADGDVRRMRYSRSDTSGKAEQEALVRTFGLRGGYRLLVGRDLSEQMRFSDLLSKALRLWLISVVVMAGITWFFVSRRVMKRIDDMSATSRTIMTGDLSQRLPVAGNGDEFDRLASNLNIMLERIELLMRSMKDVTDNIAHDLKTPLTRLRTRVEASLRDGKDEAAHREALEMTLEESDHLLRIFDALLRIARIEAMTPGAGMGEVDLASLVEEMADLYEPVLEDEGGTLETVCTGDLKVLGNRDLLAQVVVNLIENALKYGRPKEGDLKVTIEADRQGETVVLSVCDNGPGIPDGKQEKVKDRFVRLDESRSEPGTGLGLSLVTAVSRLHGSELRLKNEDPGLCARIELKASETRKGGKGHGQDKHERINDPKGG